MTEPREPEFPQPEGATPVVPSSPAGEWPQPPAAASFPPPPTAGGAFAGAVPPLPPVPGVPPVPPPAPQPVWADPAGAAATPTWSNPVPEPVEEPAPTWAEPTAVISTSEPQTEAPVDPVVPEASAIPATEDVAEPVPVAVWGTPSPVEPEPAVAEPEAASEEPVVAEALPIPEAVVAPDDQSVPATVETEPTPVASWGESSVPSPSMDEVPVSATPVPEPVAAQTEPTAVIAQPAGEAVAEVDEPSATTAAETASATAALPTVPVWTQPEPAQPEPLAAAEPAVLLPPAPPAVASMPAPPAPDPWSQPAGADLADDEAIFRPYPGAPAPAAEEQAVSEEERRLAAERAARRAASEAALTATIAAPGPMAAADAASTPIPEPVAPVTVVKRTTDGFWGSLGLFLVRLVMAAIFGIRGVQMLLDTTAADKLFSSTVLPMPTTMALVTSVACVLIAVSMVLGLATRYSGLGAALIAGGSLGLVYWGPWSVFVPNQFGFLGEGELLMAVVGLLLLFIGGGGWSLDRSLRSARERDKAERAA